MVLIGNQVVEYVEETNFGELPSDPAMQWLGLVESFEAGISGTYETIRHLASNASTDKLAEIVEQKVGENLSISIGMRPQDLTFWSKYCLGSASGTAEALKSISIGRITDVGGTDYFDVFKGCVVRRASLKFEHQKVATLDVELLSADYTEPGTSDYVGLGSHATKSTSAPLKFDDISAATLGGADITDYVKAVEINVEYELKTVPDIGANTSTKIVAIIPTSRTIKTLLTMDFEDLSMISAVRNGTKQDLVLTIGANTVTVKDVVFPKVTFPLKADDLIEETIESGVCTAITVA